jgi:hypothetical protein
MSTTQLAFDYIWRRVNGAYVTREMECDCGTVFVQKQVSKKFAEHFLPTEGSRNMFLFLTPGGYLPVLCHRCERLQLQGKAHPRKKQ